MEMRDLDITSGGDIAVARWFSRASRTLQDGREVGFWVRVTNCCRRTDKGWLITHEHVSLPVDLATRSPAMELVPD
jgi:ketosteroid isomerase-like protein